MHQRQQAGIGLTPAFDSVGFSFKLFRELTAAEVEGNSFVSPLGIAAVLLQGALVRLGMGVAFEQELADFGYLSDLPLHVGDIIHRATLDVDEHGTEASAVTLMDAIALGFDPNEPAPFRMVVDRPFFCAIRERRSGALLFMGLIVNPETA